MPKYRFGEIFERLGIPGKGQQGETWCDINPDGVLVLVAHQNYFHRRNGQWIYEMPNRGEMPKRGPSATRSFAKMAAYFQPDRPIILPVAVFNPDGYVGPDGKWVQSNFDHATGDVYKARMREFDGTTGYLLCDVDEKFAV